MLLEFLPLLIAYLIGSIPFGVIISKIYRVDIRSIGSGNIGATNVFRNLGAKPGMAVFIFDAAKGAIAIQIAFMLLPPDIEFRYWLLVSTGAMAIIGHMYPIFLKFRGGKGGATSMGVLIGLMPNVALIAAGTFLITLFLTKFVSISTMTTAIAATTAIWLTAKPDEYLIVAVIMTLLIIIKHIQNIRRIFSGTEPKVGLSSKAQRAKEDKKS